MTNNSVFYLEKEKSDESTDDLARLNEINNKTKTSQFIGDNTNITDRCNANTNNKNMHNDFFNSTLQYSLLKDNIENEEAVIVRNNTNLKNQDSNFLPNINTKYDRKTLSEGKDDDYNSVEENTLNSNIQKKFNNSFNSNIDKNKRRVHI